MLESEIDGQQVKLIGEVNDKTKQQFLAEAVALLFPIDWPEPFGLVMIEAMACGTPVIAFRSGSVPEVIDDGITGFIVMDEAEAVQAVKRVEDIDRRAIRRRFEQRFSAKRMAQDYVQHYKTLIGNTFAHHEDEILAMGKPTRASSCHVAEAMGRWRFRLSSLRMVEPCPEFPMMGFGRSLKEHPWPNDHTVDPTPVVKKKSTMRKRHNKDQHNDIAGIPCA